MPDKTNEGAHDNSRKGIVLKKICEIGQNVIPESITVSSNQEKIAYVMKNQGFFEKERVYLNGVADSSPYTGIFPESLAFSRDSKRLAYIVVGYILKNVAALMSGIPQLVAYHRKELVSMYPSYFALVVDGKRQRKHVLVSDVVFNLQSAYSYITNRNAGQDTQQSYIIEGRGKQNEYNHVKGIQFSHDGKSFAYEGIKYSEGPYKSTNRDRYVIFNGEEIGKAAFQSAIAISPDGKRVAFHQASKKGGLYETESDEMNDPEEGLLFGISPDELEIRRMDDLKIITFSEKGDCYAFLVERQLSTYFVLKNGRLVNTEIGLSLFPLKRDDAYKRKKCYRLIDKSTAKEQELGWDEILVWSSDLERCAFVGQSQVADMLVVVVDGVAGKSYDRVFDLKFSPDNVHFTYCAFLKETYYLIYDGQELGPYTNITRDSFVFSHDSSRYAFIAQKWKGPIVVTHDMEYDGSYDEVKCLAFSETGHLAFIARIGERWWVVLNGKKIIESSACAKGMEPYFDSNDNLHILIQRDSTMYHCEILSDHEG